MQPSSDAADARLAVNVEACEERGGRELPKDAIVLGSVFSLQKKGIGSLLGIQVPMFLHAQYKQLITNRVV